MSLSVPEAARRLGISEARVRQRIKDGSIAAERIGGRWVVEGSSLPRVEKHVHSRPLSPKMAWAVLDVLAGKRPDVRPEQAVRVRRYAHKIRHAEDPAPLMRAWFKRRADRRHFRVASADIADLSADSRVRLAGLSGPGSGIVAQGLVEFYVDSDHLNDLIDDYFLVSAKQGQANVIVHVGPKHLIDDKNAPAVIAADLADHAGPRESARVREIISALEANA